MTDEYMKGHQDGIAVSKDVAELLLAQANSEKAALIRRIDELGAELEKLQEENQSIGMAAYEMGRSSLEVENTKLRELIQRLYANLRNRETILELMGMPPSEAVKYEMMAIIDKCSELGIEVDG